jgi:diguanylate cyclase (GGDEF)-like protein
MENRKKAPEVPRHLGTTRPNLDPYGHLLRMLVPRASGIGFYDASGTALWSADGYDGPDPQLVVEEAIESAPPATNAQIEGFSRDFAGAPAYAFRMRGESGELIAIAVLMIRDGDNTPYSFVLQLVRPALECLQRELVSHAAVSVMSRDLQARDDDLDLLLKVAPDDPQNPQQADELGLLVQTCVDHLGCVLGALVVPERNVAICKSKSGTKPQVSILSATHRHLLNWSTLQRRSLLINKVNKAAAGLPPYKILSVPVRHASGRVIGFLAMFRDAAADDFDLRAERLCELLARKSSTVLQNNFDSATSLLTRQAFELQVRAVLAGAGNNPSCVLYLDADRMHVINDNFGMHVGDEIIGKIADVLRSKPRPGALAARVSGDRFAVFLPKCKLEFAEQIAETVCRQCSQLSYARGEGTVQVSASIGVAELSDGPAALAHGMASAEIACKAAKDRGRGRVEVFQDADQSIMRRHTDVMIVQRLHEALDKDWFVLYVQPILPLATEGGEPRFEVLLRMLSEAGEIIAPEKFLSAAERYQILPQIDRWVVQNALAALKPHAAMLRSRVGMRFSINVSGPSIADEPFLAFIESALRESGLPPEAICFELTETAAISNLARADRLMQRMRALGCSFALDDFGTGLSSLAYLKSLPVSTLKIDGSFVRDTASNPRTESMVRAIAQLAHTMGMETVAEYVETDELRVRMAALGVDYGQGFAIGRPGPLSDVLSDLALYEAMSPAAAQPTQPARRARGSQPAA